MYEHSLLRATGQMWKLYVATALVVPGAVIFVVGAITSLSHLLDVQFPKVAVLGLFIGFLGAAFASVTIRCPACGAHWYWSIVKTQERGWVQKLIARAAGPHCKFTLHSLSGRGDR